MYLILFAGNALYCAGLSERERKLPQMKRNFRIIIDAKQTTWLHAGAAQWASVAECSYLEAG